MNTATKQLSKSDVQAKAEELIKKNGKTTTKEVKEALRRDGFWAVQSEVSSHMIDICDNDDDWDSVTDSSNTYRIYTKDDGTDSSANIFLVSDDDDDEEDSQTFETVKSILCDKLGVDDSEVEMTSDLVNDLGADSLDCVEIIMEMEKEFNVAIPDDEAEKMQNVGDLVKWLDNKTSTTSKKPFQSSSNSGSSYMRRDGHKIFTTSSPSKGDWSVSSNNGSTLYFDGSYKRDDVRQAYASMNDVHFHKTRSKRVK